MSLNHDHVASILPLNLELIPLYSKRMFPILVFFKYLLYEAVSPTCPDAPLGWLADDHWSVTGPAPTNGHHGEIVESPWKHPGQDAPGQESLCDCQRVWWSPLETETVVVSEGGARPHQLDAAIGRTLFDRQVSGRFWSCVRNKTFTSAQDSLNFCSRLLLSYMCVPSLTHDWSVLRCV